MSTNKILEPTEPAPAAIMRFPREAERDDKLMTERAALEASVFKLFANRRKMIVEIGRSLNGIRRTLRPHETWKSYYQNTFGSEGVTLRTVRRWMALARKEDEESQKPGEDKMSSFPVAMDPQAVKTRAATTKAEAELGRSRTSKVRVNGIFKTPLWMTRRRDPLRE